MIIAVIILALLLALAVFVYGKWMWHLGWKAGIKWCKDMAEHHPGS